ncbi:MAG: 6,7-dimethyl-8-ribityllumazine synthase [Bdellovibrionales bacterium]|nr:6,7-dimethyl-8-ribityllumazine synthase [Bdellovibrionales bacterium]
MNSEIRIAIVASQFNEEITSGLLAGACEVLTENGITAVDQFRAPGAFEMPLIAKQAAKTGRYSGVICLGCVIKGDTAHFEFISLGAALGIQLASLESEVPIAFGVLTTYTDAQAILRSGKDEHNKGREAALAVLGSIQTIREIAR